MLPWNSTALTQTSCTIVFLGGYGYDNQPYACSVSRCQKETLWKQELNKQTFCLVPSPSPVCQRWNFKVLDWAIMISNLLGDFHVSALVGLQSSGFSDLLCSVFVWKEGCSGESKSVLSFLQSVVFCWVFLLQTLAASVAWKHWKLLTSCKKK